MTVRCHCELDSQSQILGQAQNDKGMLGMTIVCHSEPKVKNLCEIGDV
ncbi:MAG: hypothetical protein LBH96_02310 [Candidatus Peribacteria bacterium]|nr:hypothetical protein [Candidatus Peribacteria bacterium]